MQTKRKVFNKMTKDNTVNRVGFIRTIAHGFCPVFEIIDRNGVEPNKIVYLESPTKRYVYTLTEVIEKND